MPEELSLRERKKRETRQRIADIAMGLFMMRGFEKVTVAEVAEAADVSVNTVFNYFNTKEDLFLDRQDIAVQSVARLAADAPPDEPLVTTLRRDYAKALQAGDWRYGIHAGVADFARIVAESPSLQARLRELHELREQALAAALADRTDADPDDPTPRLVAAQVIALLRTVSEDFRQRRLAGQSTEIALPAIRRVADRAFALLESGVGDYPAQH